MGCPEHKADEDWVTGTAGARGFAAPGDLFFGPETRGQRHRNEYWRFPPHVYSAASWLAAITPGRPGKTAFRSSLWLVINPSRPHDSLQVLGSCVGYLVAFGPRRLTDSAHQARINPLSGDPSVPGGSRARLRLNKGNSRRRSKSEVDVPHTRSRHELPLSLLSLFLLFSPLRRRLAAPQGPAQPQRPSDLLITIPSQVSTVSLFTREAKRRGGQGRLGLHSCTRRHCRSSSYLLGFLGR